MGGFAFDTPVGMNNTLMGNGGGCNQSQVNGRFLMYRDRLKWWAVGPRLREHALRGQNEPEGGIHAT